MYKSVVAFPCFVEAFTSGYFNQTKALLTEVTMPLRTRCIVVVDIK
jgi:hypothetical protein